MCSYRRSLSPPRGGEQRTLLQKGQLFVTDTTELFSLHRGLPPSPEFPVCRYPFSALCATDRRPLFDISHDHTYCTRVMAPPAAFERGQIPQQLERPRAPRPPDRLQEGWPCAARGQENKLRRRGRRGDGRLSNIAAARHAGSVMYQSCRVGDGLWDTGGLVGSVGGAWMRGGRLRMQYEYGK